MTPNNSAKNAKVLIVDDRALIRTAFKSTLAAAGVVSVIEAESGEEALGLLDEPAHGVDIVFCDILMPEMDGVKLVGRLAMLTVQPAVVFLSDVDEALLNTARDIAAAQGLRVLGTIKKPLTLVAAQRMLTEFYGTPVDTGVIAARAADSPHPQIHSLF